MWPLPQRPLYLRVEDVGIGPQKRGRQLLYPSVMWITFAGFRIYPAMEREKYSAPA